VIVNYKSAHLTIECLRSLVSEVQALPGIRVFVVENDSGADQVALIQAEIAGNGWSDWAEVLPAERNGGFSYGNNFAIRPALATATPPNYFLLLNPDTVIYPGALSAMVSFMDANPQIGIGGSSLANADGSPWPIGFRFPSILSEFDSALNLGIVTKLLKRWVVAQELEQKEQAIDWLPGACMIIRRQVFETIGLMDEEYFLYYEETDFCRQAKLAGWQCWYIPQSRVMHIAGQSTGVTVRDQIPQRIPAYWYDSRRRYFAKNHGVLYTYLTDATWVVGYILWEIRRFIQRKPNHHPPNYFGDFILNSIFFKGWKKA
jgi:GT2 family glycosyltransferase